MTESRPPQQPQSSLCVVRKMQATSENEADGVSAAAAGANQAQAIVRSPQQKPAIEITRMPAMHGGQFRAIMKEPWPARGETAAGFIISSSARKML